MMFDVAIKGAAELDQVTATLVGGGQSMTQRPSRDTSEKWGGEWRDVRVLSFSFNLPCDFNGNYQLTVSGVRKNSRPLTVPSIIFEPRTERYWVN
jgi:hypothetical protein